MIVCPRAVVFSFRTANSEYTQKSSKISYIYLCVQESLNARRGNKLSPSSGTFSSQNVKNDASNIVYSRDGANCNYISPHYHTTFSRPAFSHDRRSLPYRLLLIASYNWLEVETLSSISYQRILDFHSTHHGTKHPTIDSARGSTQHDHNQFASSGFSRSGGNHGDTH